MQSLNKKKTLHKLGTKKVLQTDRRTDRLDLLLDLLSLKDSRLIWVVSLIDFFWYEKNKKLFENMLLTWHNLFDCFWL